MNKKDMKSAISRLMAKAKLALKGRKEWVVVVGSEGSSAAAALVVGLLSSSFKTELIGLGSEGLASKIGSVGKDSEIVVVDFDLGSERDVTNLTGLVRPSTVVITSVGEPQGEFEGNVEYYSGVVKKLAQAVGGTGLVVVNFDEVELRKLPRGVRGNVVYFGSNGEECILWAGKGRILDFRTLFEMNMGVEKVQVSSPILGIRRVSNQLAAAAVGVNYGLKLTGIKNYLEGATGLRGQMEVLPGVQGSVVLDDSYSNSYFSLEDALETLDKIPAKRRIVVLSGVRDKSAGRSQNERIARKLFKQNTDYCFLVGKGGKIIGEELRSLGFDESRLESSLDISGVVGKVARLVGRGDVILVKTGSQARDEIVERLVKN